MVIGSKIFHKDKVFNSMDWAKENLETAPNGSVFIANFHEHTRGRQERTWVFDKDQLTATILLKPTNLNAISEKDLPLRLNQLNMAITLGILKPLRKFEIELKWANDFYYDGKKLGGILSQVEWQNNKIIGIIIGFALNVNNSSPQLAKEGYKAISIFEILNKKIDKEVLLKEIISSMNYFYNKWLHLEFNEIFVSWKQNQDYLNKQVTIHKKNGSLTSGTFINVLENGDIQIKKGPEIIQIPFYFVENLY
ncbi:MAG: biotin--[acetyl-CoA-carboxylase] ligase [bacterium]